MAMGNWKLKKLKRQLAGRSNSTRSSKARITVVYPPEEGWKGGSPEANGFRRRGGK